MKEILAQTGVPSSPSRKDMGGLAIWMPLPEPPKERVSNDAKEKSEEQAGDAG
jgi:hypothetical protein